MGLGDHLEFVEKQRFRRTRREHCRDNVALNARTTGDTASSR
jgi:hypothetical protein